MKIIKVIADRSSFLSWLWLLVITLLLVTNGNKFPETNLGDIPYFDKIVHIALFAISAWLFIMGYGINKITCKFIRANVWLIVTMHIVYGIIMEFVQKYWVPYRSFEIQDIIADTLGVFLGTAIALRPWNGKA